MALTEGEKKHEKREKPCTKVVIRRLPPLMDKETFLNQVSPIPDYNYIYNVKGDASLGENSFSRVFINFVNAEDVFSFRERFDNYVFLDNKGHEYPAVVEFAPFQKIPKKRGKIRIDPKCGTIESDPIYMEFIESLDKPKEQDEKPEYTLQLTSENKNDVTTPLLEFIKNKRVQKMKIREVRREERKRREFDRRKERYEDRRKSADEKSSENISSKAPVKNEEKADEQMTENREVKVEKTYEKTFYNKNRDKRYEERKFDDKRKDKPRFPKKQYDNHDYKEKEFRTTKYDDYKKEDTTAYPKKVKKYSEKREERRLEAQKAEQKKAECANDSKLKETNKQSPNAKVTSNKDPEVVKPAPAKQETAKLTKVESAPTDPQPSGNCEKEATKPETKTEKDKGKDTETQSQRRIRNKNRPTIEIYRPGMLSKRKNPENTDSAEKRSESPIPESKT